MGDDNHLAHEGRTGRPQQFHANVSKAITPKLSLQSYHSKAGGEGCANKVKGLAPPAAMQAAPVAKLAHLEISAFGRRGVNRMMFSIECISTQKSSSRGSNAGCQEIEFNFLR
jgi:hypothetical protein